MNDRQPASTCQLELGAAGVGPAVGAAAQHARGAHGGSWVPYSRNRHRQVWVLAVVLLGKPTGGFGGGEGSWLVSWRQFDVLC